MDSYVARCTDFAAFSSSIPDGTPEAAGGSAVCADEWWYLRSSNDGIKSRSAAVDISFAHCHMSTCSA